MYPTLELDYNKLLDMVSEMGYRLMKSGAEIYRVESPFSGFSRPTVPTGRSLPFPTA